MKIESIKNNSFYNSRVIVRADFNVPLESGKVADDFKIRRTIPTINLLKKKGAKIILISHLGRPQKIKKKKLYSLKPVKKRLEELLGEKIIFSSKLKGKRLEIRTKRLKPGKIILLENLRFDKGEEKNNKKFTKKLSALGDCYVNEAFSVSHRSHASIVGLPEIMPHFAGLDFEKELDSLSKINNPKRPLTIIIGGAKIASKIKGIRSLLKIADHIIIGGLVADVILRVKGIRLGKPWPDEETIENIRKIEITNPKIHLPVDVLASPEKGDDYVRESALGSLMKEEKICDIGEETIKTFSGILEESKTIFWAGPLGIFEDKRFSRGTREIAEVVSDQQHTFKVAGGGDTIRAIRDFGLEEKFSFISMAGSAMLRYLSGEEMPGLEALK